jgi:uncharacterized membrane-anchored protein
MKKIILLLACICLQMIGFAKKQDSKKDTDTTGQSELLEMLDKTSKIEYKHGVVDFNSDIKLNVPNGYKFIGEKDARYIVIDLWGNPADSKIGGMIVREDYTPMDDAQWAFIVNYDESGYVKDDDADKIDYDEMLKSLQDAEKEENAERTKAGYGTTHMIGWAAKPFYDKKEKILHWAKSIKFSGTEDTTLNYDVRILGRKGLLSMNAVASNSQLADVQKHIPEIIHVASFKEGSKYTDFDGKTDKVAAYTIGGLVAGKILAKVGFFALILKNIKLVMLAVAGVFGALRNKIAGWFGSRKE